MSSILLPSCEVINGMYQMGCYVGGGAVTRFKEIKHGLYVAGAAGLDQLVSTTKGLEKITKLAIASLNLASLVPAIGAGAAIVSKQFSLLKDMMYITGGISAVVLLMSTWDNFWKTRNQTAAAQQAYNTTNNAVNLNKLEQANYSYYLAASNLGSDFLLAVGGVLKADKLLKKYAGIHMSFFTSFSNYCGQFRVCQLGKENPIPYSYPNPFPYLTTRPDDFFVLMSCLWKLGFATVSYATNLCGQGRVKEMETKNLLTRTGEIGKSLLITQGLADLVPPNWSQLTNYVTDFVTQLSSTIKEVLPR